MTHLTLHSVFADINVWCINCLLEINFNGFVLLYLCLTYLKSFIMPRVRQRGNYRQLSEFDRGRIVGLREGGKVVFHTGKLQIALTGTNSPLCAVINHGLGKVRKDAKEEPEAEEELMRYRTAAFA